MLVSNYTDMHQTNFRNAYTNSSKKKIIIIPGFFIQEVVRKMQLNANKNVQ